MTRYPVVEVGVRFPIPHRPGTILEVRRLPNQWPPHWLVRPVRAFDQSLTGMQGRWARFSRKQSPTRGLSRVFGRDRPILWTGRVLEMVDLVRQSPRLPLYCRPFWSRDPVLPRRHPWEQAGLSRYHRQIRLL